MFIGTTVKRHNIQINYTNFGTAIKEKPWINLKVDLRAFPSNPPPAPMITAPFSSSTTCWRMAPATGSTWPLVNERNIVLNLLHTAREERLLGSLRRSVLMLEYSANARERRMATRASMYKGQGRPCRPRRVLSLWIHLMRRTPVKMKLSCLFCMLLSLSIHNINHNLH